MKVMISDAPSSGSQDRPEGITQEVEEAVQPGEPAARGLLLGSALDVGIAAGLLCAGRRAALLHLGQRHDVVVDALDRPADHHLVAVAALRDRTHHAGDRLHLLLVDARVVMQLETQAGGAMGQVLDVVGAPDAGKDLCWGVDI